MKKLFCESVSKVNMYKYDEFERKSLFTIRSDWPLILKSCESRNFLLMIRAKGENEKTAVEK